MVAKNKGLMLGAKYGYLVHELIMTGKLRIWWMNGGDSEIDESWLLNFEYVYIS